MARLKHESRQPAYSHAEQETLVFVFVFVIVLVFKRLGERFMDLNIPSVLVTAMDVSNETPPPELPITFATLPTIVLLTGDDKGPPYRQEGIRHVHQGKQQWRSSNVTFIKYRIWFSSQVPCGSKHFS